MRLKRGRKAHCPLGGCLKTKCVGYCHLHKVDLTVRQMKNRQCRAKDCSHFIPRKQHDYWRDHGPQTWREANRQMKEEQT